MRIKKRAMNSFTIFRFKNLGVFPALSSLGEVKHFERYARKEFGIDNGDQLSFGYAFLIALVIERLIDAILLDPKLFGFHFNEFVERSLQTDVSFSEFPNRSYLGRTVRNLSYMYRGLLSVRTLSELEERVAPIRYHLLPLLQKHDRRFKFFDHWNDRMKIEQDVRRDFCIQFLLDFVQDISYVKVALSNTFHRGRRFEPQFHELPTRIGLQRFFEGFKLGVSYLWDSVLPDSPAKSLIVGSLRKAKNWNEYYLLHPVIRKELADEAEKRLAGVTYALDPVVSPEAWLADVVAADSNERADVADRLDELFRRYEVRIVIENYTARAASAFFITLLGVKDLFKDKPRIIRFVHGDSAGQNHFSYAIFVWIPTPIGNQSQWWLFYDFCDDYSPRGLSALSPIEKYMEDHKNQIEILTCRISASELFAYVLTHPDNSRLVMDPLIRERINLDSLSGLRVLLAKDRAEKDFARGLVLELMVMNIATKLGYDTRWRFKGRSLGKEIDVLGFRKKKGGTCEFLVVECSTKYSPGFLKELQGKITLVESKANALSVVFGDECEERLTVKGWLVLTEFMGHPKQKIPSNIDIFDWQGLSELCRSRGITPPPGLKELLTKVEMPLSAVINPPSSMSGTTPPPSGKQQEAVPSPRKAIYLHDGFLLPRKLRDILDKEG